MKNRITLAIETAIGNGSLSLFENDYLIDVRSGKEKISRSDRLLPIILEFLVENKVEKKDLSLIAVSRGPGSYTGARIGLATAIGLKNGLNVPCAGISVFQALALTAAPIQTGAPFIITLLSDDEHIIRLNSDDLDDIRNNSVEPQTQSLADFIAELALIKRHTSVILDKKLFGIIKNWSEIKKNYSHKHPVNHLLKFAEIDGSLSTHIGKAVLANNGSDNLIAFYLSSNRNFY